MKKENKNIENDDMLPDVLKKAGKVNVFNTPPGYFENLSNELELKIAAETIQPARVRHLNVTGISFIAGIAALILIAVLFAVNVLKTEKITPVTLSYDDLVNTGVAAQIDEYTLYDVYEASEATATNESGSSDSQSQINDYLIDNHTDINLIINEL